MGCGASTCCAKRQTLEDKHQLGFPTATTLQEFFEQGYQKGWLFEHEDYAWSDRVEKWGWTHQPSNIFVWGDAIDLTRGGAPRVYFHYTNELAFRNITDESKEVVEVLASMRTSGPLANAWWGQGIYTVPKEPASWVSCMEILDNNFRNMMARDRNSKGEDFVNAEYPPRVAYCIPILADEELCYDVSVRATPDMEAAGKAPGINLADKALTEPGLPARVCVVIRVEDSEHQVQAASARLTDTLRLRAAALARQPGQHGATVSARSRLAWALLRRGKGNAALKVLQTALPDAQEHLGFKDPKTLICASAMAEALSAVGKLKEAEKLYRNVLAGREQVFSTSHPDTLRSATNLACLLQKRGMSDEAGLLFRRALEGEEQYFGKEHPDTLRSVSNLAAFLLSMGKLEEAYQLSSRAVQSREKLLGKCHPHTLVSVNNLAAVLQAQGKLSEAEHLFRRAAEGQEGQLGLQHPETKQSLKNLVNVLQEQGETTETEEFKLRIVHPMDEMATPLALQGAATWDDDRSEGDALRNLLDMLTSSEGSGASQESRSPRDQGIDAPDVDPRSKYKARFLSSQGIFQTGGGPRCAAQRNSKDSADSNDSNTRE